MGDSLVVQSKSNMVPLVEIEKMARAVAVSGLFGIKTPEQAMALMLVAQAEGRHPALAARDYDIIQGRPAKKAEAMMRDFIESGGKVEWHKLDDTSAEATFSHPQGGSVRIDWTIERAKTAGMGGKDMWKKYPRQMLRSRTVSEGVRTVCPMATSGMYVPEEVMDFKTEKNITPTAGASERVGAGRQVEITDISEKVKQWMSEGSLTDAFLEIDNAGLDADEKVYLWTMFDSGTRRQLKEEAARQHTRNAAKEVKVVDAVVVISDAQRKRLEARIGELGLSRDKVKSLVKEQYGKDHFADLSKNEYEVLDAYLEDFAKEAAPPATPLDSPASSPLAAETQQVGAAPCLTFEQEHSIADLLIEKKIDKAKLLAVAEKVSGDVYLSLSQLPESFYARAVKWVEEQK